MIAEELVRSRRRRRAASPSSSSSRTRSSTRCRRRPTPRSRRSTTRTRTQLGGADARPGEAAHRRVPEAAGGAQARQQAFIDELKKKYKTTVALRPPTVEVATGGPPPRGPGQRAGHDHRVLGLRVPVLQARRGDGRAGAEDVRRQGAASSTATSRCPFHARRAPGRRGGGLRQRAGQVLGVPRQALRSRRSSRRPNAEADRRARSGSTSTKFDACVAEGDAQGTIDKDIADGQAVGVNGTPAFFINGRMLSGAQPFEKFKEIIDEELRAARSPRRAERPRGRRVDTDVPPGAQFSGPPSDCDGADPCRACSI